MAIFDIPVSARPESDMPVGQDEMGRMVYRTVTGQTYTLPEPPRMMPQPGPMQGPSAYAAPDRMAGMRQYASQLQNILGAYNEEDLLAAGYTPAEVSAFATGQQRPLRDDPSMATFQQESNRDRQLPSNVAMAEPRTQTMMETATGALQDRLMQYAGMDQYTARKYAKDVLGDPNAANILDSMGLVDIAAMILGGGAVTAAAKGVGLAGRAAMAAPAAITGMFSAEEGARTAAQGYQQGDALTTGMGVAQAGLGALEAVPFAGAAARGLTATAQRMDPNTMFSLVGPPARLDAPFDAGRGMGDNGGPALSPIASVNLPAGSDPRYRGAAPNRTTEYPRYSPKDVPERMKRLISSADDPANPINSIFDNYIERGNQLGGQSWYNTEEMRDWFVGTLGEQAGDSRWREFVRLIGATSTGSDVASNLRNASFYNALEPADRVAVASRVSQGGITPAAAARELGIEPANTPTNYNYGHVMQGNHAKNVLAQSRGEWEPKMPEGLTKGQQSDWLKANPKVKGFANDLLGSESNIAADKHFMRMLAMSDGGTDFLTEQAQLSGANLAKLRAVYGDALEPYIKTRKTGTGALVIETNLAKAVKDGVITDTSAFKEMPTAWLDVPKDGEYAALEEMAQRMGKRYGMTPAQFQAALWMGAGDITGLADESQGTAMELFRRTLDKRAKERGLTREGMLNEFIMNRAPLSVAGAGLGLSTMLPNQEEPQ